MTRQGRVPLSAQVYEAVRRDLAEGALVSTERLGEERLADSYGVSRTPVREALARLLADGLVERRTDGLYPFRPRLEELDQLYELRNVLESRGIHRALGEPTHDLDMVRAELDIWRRLAENPPEPGPSLIAADDQFHTMLLRSAGNAALADALVSVQVRVRPVRTMDMPTPDRIAAMTAEHIAIAEQLLAGDRAAALDTLTTHIDSSRSHVIARAKAALHLTRLAQVVRD
ncbi:GntR family transcriptional regulator [Nocardia cyriacigeorgica]|uniref:GntR family transcriptional regulator n=1 Tax=Nocardia cyriacigeorgica TaxID=135487 RepID=A0A6P1D3G2_9NOCA|nr:GntR family transcriptional regulator [Nocardia cyriacigeorgica]NEW39577.1 GntR family transcriptional regulator [Nocardia cyriacigeorgica]NEW43991.1 GntR family transcriptional regulator [Nocardia cyriacigeorgica]NEW50066.1 GntR family transcriptional regulator [Nocardia cyriacigeorgica]NEW56539.1 GntR family transcriptional regulator [Nocardia cyriacigeorgica]